MAQTYLVCSKCVGRRIVNNIMMKVNSKVVVTTVPPGRPLAYTRQPIFDSASVHPGHDGLVRTVTVKYDGKEFKRRIVRVSVSIGGHEHSHEA
jgi:hypothetical protein